MQLRLLPGTFAICRLDPAAPVPDDFWSATRTEDELSVICRDEAIPDGAIVQRGWRGRRWRVRWTSP